MKIIKRLSRIFCLILAIIFMCPMISCNKKTSKPVLGVDDILIKRKNTYTSIDDMYANIDEKIALMKSMGIKSHRLRVNIGYHDDMNSLLSIQEDGSIAVNEENAKIYRHVIESLIKNGITEIIANCHYFYMNDGSKYYVVSGSEYYNNGWNYVPSDENEHYLDFLKGIEEQFALITPILKDVKIIEVGNELNDIFMCLDGKRYSSSEKQASVVLDLTYYANKGIKRCNDQIKISTAGFSQNNINLFLDELYSLIESGTKPFGIGNITKVDDYFDYMCWHPYFDTNNFQAFTADDYAERFKQYNDVIYGTLEAHGDKNRKVIFSEFGFCHTAKSDEEEKKIGEAYVSVYKTILKMPYVANVQLFIFSDHGNPGAFEEGMDFNLTARDEEGKYYARKRMTVLMDYVNAK